MKRTTGTRLHKTIIAGAAAIILGIGNLMAQPTPPPPPGPGPVQTPPPPGMTPPPAPGTTPPPPGQAPPPPAPPGWGYSGYLGAAPAGDWMNEGTINVMATGYDSESVLVQIPLNVSYSFNGVNYDVTVLNAYSPLTQTWNVGVDTPAYQTDYFFNGFNYNYYVVLPSGTYYFNL